ncbi:MAG TPA: hypothetical protein VL523_08800 [Terriglobia bacterium]|nr:hypothetical protein [Terriglobia bacterium]
MLQEAEIETRKGKLRSSAWKWAGAAVGLVLLLVGGAAAYLRWLSPLSRSWVTKALSDHYACDVELKSLNSSLFPAVTMSGEGLVLRRRDRPGLPPMASVERFSVTATWLGLLRHPRHFSEVRLEGLALNVPPRHSAPPSAGGAETGSAKKKRPAPPPFVLDNVIADGTSLSIISSKPNKPPTLFDIRRLRLQSAGVGPPMRFEAVLTNPRPVGDIESSGSFGPWNADEPSLTPVKGQYTFRHADLATIRGLRGMLSSRGAYGGVLSSINVQGETDTPDFALAISGNPVHLRTQFEALVDGVSGDTLLQPVTAQLLSSSIVARGGVVKTPGRSGRTIHLDVTAGPARLQDLLQLAVKSSTSPMLGDVRIEARLDLLPGEQDITRRLQLAGDFNIDAARFTNPQAEAKIRTLSRIGRGRHTEDDSASAPLRLNGHFQVADGVARFPRLDFSVPGASVHLQGTFGLESQVLDFEGTLRLQATVSQLTTGAKSVLLKPFDRLFERGGAGTVLPIRITGTRDSPSFALEVGKILRR